MNVLDLFSGIGGFSLGLERAGMRTVAFCEIDPFCRRVLAKHWPNVPCHDDVRTLDGRALVVDVICGGFPCQDISQAGLRAGITGSRSGLWQHLVRAIRLVRPQYAIVENVAALLGRGMGDVLGDLAEIGYDAEWHCIPASAVGAPHRRDRIWIIAADASRGGNGLDGIGEALERQLGDSVADLADAARSGLEGRDSEVLREHPGQRPVGLRGACETFSDANGQGRAQPIWPSEAIQRARPSEFARPQRSGRDQWLIEPDVGRVAHGVPARVDRLRSLGNAVVPQIPEIIGRAIMSIVNAPIGDKS